MQTKPERPTNSTSTRRRQAGGTPGACTCSEETTRGGETGVYLIFIFTEGGGGGQVKHSEVQWEITGGTPDWNRTASTSTTLHTVWGNLIRCLCDRCKAFHNIFMSHMQVSGPWITFTFSLFRLVHCVILYRNKICASHVAHESAPNDYKCHVCALGATDCNSLVTKTSNCWMKLKKEEIKMSHVLDSRDIIPLMHRCHHSGQLIKSHFLVNY